MRLVLCLLVLVNLVGCTHLLYPADRNYFYDPQKMHPAPIELSIPVGGQINRAAVDSAAQIDGTLHAWFFPAESPKPKGLVLHFHGNGQNLTAHFLFFLWVIKEGYHYVIFDYRGYGQSSDESASPRKTVEDGVAMFRFVREKFRGVPVIAIGQSLGSNVLQRVLQEMNSSVDLRNELPSFVVFDSSFQSYQKAAASVLSQKWYLYPLKPLAYLTINDTWSSERKSELSPKIPALFIHSTRDTMIREQLGKENYEKWPGPKVYYKVIGGHTAAFGTPENFGLSRSVFLNCSKAAITNVTTFPSCLTETIGE